MAVVPERNPAFDPTQLFRANDPTAGPSALDQILNLIKIARQNVGPLPTESASGKSLGTIGLTFGGGSPMPWGGTSQGGPVSDAFTAAPEDTAAQRALKNVISGGAGVVSGAGKGAWDFFTKPIGDQKVAGVSPTPSIFGSDATTVFGSGSKEPISMTVGGKPGGYFNTLYGTESQFKPWAQNQKSSAGGLAQFVDETWLNTIKDAKPAWAEGKTRQQLLDLKYDPVKNHEMNKVFTLRNAQTLEASDMPVNNSTLYLAHFLGAGGALQLYHSNANTPIREIVGEKAYKANLNKEGKFVYGETAGAVRNNIEKKFGTTLDLGDDIEGFPKPTEQQAAQLPGAPTLKTPSGVDVSGYMEALEKGRPEVDKPGQYDWLNRLGQTLGAAAGKTTGLHRVGDILAAAGGGAAAGAREYDKDVADRLERQKDRLNAFNVMMANAGLNVRQIEAQNRNLGITTENQNITNRFERDKLQATLDAQTQHLNAQTANQFNLEKFKLGVPHISATKDHVISQIYNPSTNKSEVTMIPLDNSEEAEKRLKHLGEIAGESSNTYRTARDLFMMRKGGATAIRDNLLSDAVTDGTVSKIIGADNYKKLDDAVKKEVGPGNMGTTKWQTEYNNHMLASLRRMMLDGRLKEADLLRELANTGHSTAKLLYIQNFGR